MLLSVSIHDMYCGVDRVVYEIIRDDKQYRNPISPYSDVVMNFDFETCARNSVIC